MRRHDSLAGHGAYCCGPYSMAVLLERTGTFSQNAPPRRGSLHSASIPLFRFLFVGRRRSLFSSHPTIFRCRLRLFAAFYRSIARFFSSAARCLWVSQSREQPLHIQASARDISAVWTNFFGESTVLRFGSVSRGGQKHPRLACDREPLTDGFLMSSSARVATPGKLPVGFALISVGRRNVPKLTDCQWYGALRVFVTRQWGHASISNFAS
jgi:hypothetical protein